jgi:hypothetical protein
MMNQISLTNMKYKYVVLLILIITVISCTKNKCTSYATCNDNSLQFGPCDSICKGIGIKFYYECERDGTLTLKGC